MKLDRVLSTTEFVLQSETPISGNVNDFLHHSNKILSYALLMKRPITKSIFVPCDENDEPYSLDELQEISRKELKSTEEVVKLLSWDNVLFNGVKIKKCTDGLSGEEFYGVQIKRVDKYEYQWCGGWDNFLSHYLLEKNCIEALSELKQFSITPNQNFKNEIGI